eukprot:c24187_g1_i1 orf=562-1887(+)
MGRSRKQRKNGRMEDTDDDSVSSISTGASSDIPLTQETEEQQDEGTILESLIDALYEKRAKTREEGLKGLIAAFKSHVLVEFADNKYETILHLCISSIKRKTGAEVIYASQVVGLLSITTGAGDIAQQVVSEASPHLIRVAKLAFDSKARTSAIESLALINFVGCPDLDMTEEVMGTFWQICSHKGNYHADQILGTNRPSAEVRATALSAWSLLLTTIPSARVLTYYMPLSLPTLSSLLDGEDQAVRVAVGEAIALFYETKNETMMRKNAFPTDSDSGDASTLSGKSFEAKEMQAIERIRSLAVEAGGKGHSSKRMQRSSFKEILATIEEGHVPEVTLKLQHGDVLKIDSWNHVIQLRLLTSLMGEGLQRHLQDNTLLHQVFGFVPRREKRQTLTAKEKRLYMSPNSVLSKTRTQIMNKRRSAAHEGQMGHFSVMRGDNND